MGWDRALAAINLEKTDRIPSMETIEHPEFVKNVSGMDPYRYPAKAYAELYKKLDLDMALLVPMTVFRVKDSSIVMDRKAKVVHTKWGAGSSAWSIEEPFRTEEEVLDYDPRLDPRLMKEISSRIIRWRKAQEIVKESTLVPPLYYTTLFMFLIMRQYKIGWHWLVKLAYTRPKELDKLIARFAEVSIRNVEAWTKENIEVFIFHDDLASSNGPFMSPKWYDEHIFPWYTKIWDHVKRKGIKLIFVSDGNYGAIIDDLTKLGADGFMIDHTINLQELAQKYEQDKVFIGNVDVNILTFGTEKDIIVEVKRCVDQGGKCPGYFFKVAEDIPYNVPVRNVEAYFKACKKFGRRQP